MSNREEYKKLQESRANLYDLISGFYRKETDAAFLEKLAALRFPKAEQRNELLEGYGLLEDFLQNHEDAEELLAVDYARIFLAAGIAYGEAAFPYESVYTSKKRIVMQEAWEDMRRICRGKGVAPESSDDFDHIGCELGYMAYLCREKAEAEDARQARKEQRSFLQEHLLNWVPEFTADVERYAQTDFYRAAARITRGFVQMDYERLAGADIPKIPFASFADVGYHVVIN